MKDKARSGAEKLCGMRTCFAGFKCGHENHIKSGVPLVQSETDVCPLKKYDIAPNNGTDPRGKYAKDTTIPTDMELISLCSECEFNKELTEEMWLNAKCACLDCPVFLYREQVLELAAEAAASE